MSFDFEGHFVSTTILLLKYSGFLNCVCVIVHLCTLSMLVLIVFEFDNAIVLIKSQIVHIKTSKVIILSMSMSSIFLFNCSSFNFTSQQFLSNVKISHSMQPSLLINRLNLVNWFFNYGIHSFKDLLSYNRKNKFFPHRNDVC